MGHHRRQLGATLHDKGVDFAVWAPFARSVALLLWKDFDWEEIPMSPDDDGNWFVDDIDAQAGRAYKYRITTTDGKILERNDPRARQITDSDSGDSIIVMRDFEWEASDDFTAAPADKSIIYEMHIGTFYRPDPSTAGTFATAAEKIPYLKELGVTHVELMPVTSMKGGRGWGYGPNHLFSVESSYGGRLGLLNFVKACHEAGIGVILDVVYNHLFDATDLWQFDGWSENNRGGIYFYNDARGDTPWGGRPDFGRTEVREFLLDNVTMWMTEYNIDGLRVDSTIYLRNFAGHDHDPDHDLPDAWSFMQEMNDRAKSINPQTLMIGEDNATTPEITASIKHGGAGFDLQWEVNFPDAIRDAFGIRHPETPATLDAVTWAITHTYDKHKPARVVFSDSHDSAANGSARINEVSEPGNGANVHARHHLLVANSIIFTSPGTPMLFQGEEFVQEGAFHEWQDLDWEKTEKFSGIVLAHKHLVDLRLNKYGNTGGLLGNNVTIFHRDDENRVIAYHRWNKGGHGDDTIIVVNFGDTRFEEYKLALPIAGQWRTRFNSSWKGYSPEFHEAIIEAVDTDKDGVITLPLAERSAIILSQD